MNFDIIETLIDSVSQQIIIAHKQGTFNDESYLKAISLVYELSGIVEDEHETYNEVMDDITTQFAEWYKEHTENREVK